MIHDAGTGDIQCLAGRAEVAGVDRERIGRRCGIERQPADGCGRRGKLDGLLGRSIERRRPIRHGRA